MCDYLVNTTVASSVIDLGLQPSVSPDVNSNLVGYSPVAIGAVASSAINLGLHSLVAPAINFNHVTIASIRESNGVFGANVAPVMNFQVRPGNSTNILSHEVDINLILLPNAEATIGGVTYNNPANETTTIYLAGNEGYSQEQAD